MSGTPQAGPDGENPEAYIAGDRRRALAAGTSLPERTSGAALFADISGFTPLTEALVAELGAQRGAEELSSILDRLFDELLGHVMEHGGSVISFSGDAVTCWLDGDDGLLATSCALAIQRAMTGAGSVRLASGRELQLAMKVAVAVGDARRFVVGDPRVQLLDVLAGALIDALAETEQQARAGEVLLDSSAVRSLGDRVHGTVRRAGARSYLVVDALTVDVVLPARPAPTPPLPEAQVRDWLLPAVFERLRVGRGEFLTELRTAVPMFCRFGVPDFDDDPDAVPKLDAFVIAVQRVIDEYGGSTLQLTIGDKGAYLYAVFGTPLAHEDDVARACSAALEVRDLEGAHAVTDLQLGLARGRVRSGTYGHRWRRTFCCLGDPVNLAARLMTASPPGAILVSADVHDVAPGYRWSRLPDQQLKGKSASVVAYELLGTRNRRRPRQRSGLPPMVGRAAALAQLEDRVAAARGGAGQLVVVRGAVGLGKSRLLAELGGLLDERGFVTARGEGQPFGTPTSYAAWHPVWRQLLRVPARLSPADQAARATRRVRKLESSVLHRVPLLGAALGVPIADNELTARLDPKLRKASLESLLVTLLERLTDAGRPLAILLDDAQWLDPLSVDLLGAITRSVIDRPVLLVLAQRSETGDDALADLAELPRLSLVDLAELDAESSRTIAATTFARLGYSDRDVSDALLDALLDRAEGNPYYLEELINFLHLRGVDLTDPSVLRSAELPDSLQGLTLSRVDTLPESPRITLKVASVVGRSFGTAMLHGTYPEVGSPVELDAQLTDLVRAGLIVRETAETRPGDDAHAFRHVITAQAAYEAIPVTLRERLHENAGDYLLRHEREGSTIGLDRLAYHYGRSANLNKKRHYLTLAARRSRADYANAAAIEHYQDLRSIVEDADRCELLLELAEVLELTGAWGGAEQVLSDALALAEARADELMIARIRRALAENARKQGRYDEAGRLLTAAEAGFTALGDRAGLGATLHVAATLAAQQGQYDLARERYEASLVIRRELGDTEQMAALFSNLAILAEYAGDYPRAQELNEQALTLRLEVGNRWAIGVSQNNLGMIALLSGDYDGAVERFTEAMRLNSEVGDQWMVAIAHNNLGNATREQGRLAASAHHFSEALAGYRRHADRWALAILFEDIAALAVLRGDHLRALRLAGAADGVRAELGSPRAPAQQETLDATLTPARESLGDDAAQAAVGYGRGLDLDAGIRLAEEVAGAGFSSA